MDEQIFSTTTDTRFKLWSKWFWIGIVVSIPSVVAGLVYGIALVLEKSRRKEGIIIIAFAIFIMVKALNSLKLSAAAPAAPAPTKEELLLTEIRDLLKQK